MWQRAIPFLLFRGGTSRGPYFRMDDLPKDRETLADVLIAALGSGHRYNIDGIGGGVAVTTKVAILTRSQDPRADIDYLFAQVLVEERRVDFRPTCGNILSGVGPAAIEMGLFEAQPGETRIRIRAVNTGALVDAMVQTPAGTVSYEGRLAIDGVPGTSAPIQLSFRETVGSVTGSLLPTGNPRDLIDGIEVTCLDVAMPVVIARAEAFGLTGAETPGALDANAAFAARREAVRIEAGKRMGMGDVAGVRDAEVRHSRPALPGRFGECAIFHADDLSPDNGGNRCAMHRRKSASTWKRRRGSRRGGRGVSHSVKVGASFRPHRRRRRL